MVSFRAHLSQFERGPTWEGAVIMHDSGLAARTGARSKVDIYTLIALGYVALTYLCLCPGNGLFLVLGALLSPDLLLRLIRAGGRGTRHCGRGIRLAVGVSPPRHVSVLAQVTCK